MAGLDWAGFFYWNEQMAVGMRQNRAGRRIWPLRCNPISLVEIVVKLDTSVTFYSEFSADIIPVWQRRHAYVRSRVARLLQKEQFSGAGSGTGSTYRFDSFIPMTGRQK
jgi:hypothetical protein